MFTRKDIENKSIFVINGREHQRLQVKSGFMHLEDTESGKTITKFPFPKILFMVVIGHTAITTALIDKCNKYKVPLVVMKPNFRSSFYFGNFADGNFLLRKRQHNEPKVRIDIARQIVINKMTNQKRLLLKTKKKDGLTVNALDYIDKALNEVENKTELTKLMALEGRVAKYYFSAYFSVIDFKTRKPRIKSDPYNTTLDIGYTFLFNFVENMCRLFGFDLYVGVYHQLWFQRKSLVCDLVEPFRCIIDNKVRNAFTKGVFEKKDFVLKNHSYYIKYGENTKYTQEFYNAIIKYKVDIFRYIQQYYRAFMGDKKIDEYPFFKYE